MQGFGGDVHVFGITLLRQENRLGDGDSQLGGDGIVEIFVVGGPPEWIVDDVGALQHGVFQIAAVVVDFVRDAIDDNAVFGAFVHARAAEFDEFRGDAIGFAELIDPGDERRRKAVFAPAEKTDLFHEALLWNEGAEDSAWLRRVRKIPRVFPRGQSRFASWHLCRSGSCDPKLRRDR